MREFDYFFYLNSDPEALAGGALNPRALMNGRTSAVLSAALDGCGFDALRRTFGEEEIDRLVSAGFLRREGGAAYPAFPFFVREDAECLRAYCDHYAVRLADALTGSLAACREIVRTIDNGVAETVNLYHVLCGMVFDGALFDCLSEAGLVATHRRQPSGFDYILIAYEQCGELFEFANALLCSYNRFTDGVCALESFGDADGDRHDLYRFARRIEAGGTTAAEEELCRLWHALGTDVKGTILREAEALYRTGRCAPDARRLLEAFGYADGGGICVPVYGTAARKAADAMSEVVWRALEGELRAALTGPRMLDALTCRRCGAAQSEVNNELYHLLFGTVGGELARRGVVASPPHRPGEGRYLKAMEIDT